MRASDRVNASSIGLVVSPARKNQETAQRVLTLAERPALQSPLSSEKQKEEPKAPAPETRASVVVDVMGAVDAIKHKFAETGSPAKISLLRGSDSFTAELTDEGVTVDNLGSQPLLPWAAFQEAVCVLIRSGGRAKRGDAMRAKLGEPDLPMDSVEGHVARVIYGKQAGDSVFRRITPMACILIWAGVCMAAPGELVLRTSV